MYTWRQTCIFPDGEVQLLAGVTVYAESFMFSALICVFSVVKTSGLGPGTLRIFCSSNVSLSGFAKTWNLNLHLVIVKIELIAI